ncbi:uncharacterized protein RHOBADRAFT_53362 [Rhodotorula graminis WP1]|uniref:DNA polymerase epsilon subunit D n=1 Tax=Rhodotorula graminis (strain WP1) TaxID=578459 RepID=A0A194S4D5_RHOGW|nr:uncharacterized protein RHOBADRAFT_53362 [Rhodotorula graminis WP1]KPV75379.1 hypothetical protein RHOBADRAFT_53362 [Rhodotorula graminis WP1]
MPRKKPAPAAADLAAEEDGGIEAFELQKSVVARLVKSSLPPDVKLQKEVPLAMVKGSTVFIAYLAALAHDTATEKNHKTIAASHVLEASKQLAWDDGGALQKMLKKELAAFRANNEAKKQGRAVPKGKKAAAEGSDAENDDDGDAVLAAAAGVGAVPEGDDGEGAAAGADDGADEAEGIELYVEEDEGAVDEEMDDAGSEGIDEPEPGAGERAADADEAEYKE